MNIKLPDNFNVKAVGSCMAAAGLLTRKYLANGYNNFNVIEGYIRLKGSEPNVPIQHTWIELHSKEKIDPTILQFDSNINNITYLNTKRKVYTPLEYIELSEKYPENFEKYYYK